MVSAKLQGGKGNQLFQIAACQSLAWENNDEAIFDLESCFTPMQGRPANCYKDGIFKNIKTGKFEPEAYYKEPNHTFSPIPYKNGLLIDGYFQSEKFFQNYRSEIKNLFYLEDLSSRFGEFTAIHVRRGDYLLNPSIFPLCTLEYYNKAMKIVGGKFLVFSDDQEWCKFNIKGENIEYSYGKNEIEDLTFMASCRNVIMANSSFSWWGAYLNKNSDCISIAPKTWFGPSGPDSRDILPESFISL